MLQTLDLQLKICSKYIKTKNQQKIILEFELLFRYCDLAIIANTFKYIKDKYNLKMNEEYKHTAQ